MSFLRAFLIRRLSTPALLECYPDFYEKDSTAQLWRWYEQQQAQAASEGRIYRFLDSWERP